MNAEKIVEKLKNMDDQEKFLLALVVGVLVSKNSYSKYLKKFYLPVMGAFVLFKSSKTDSKTIIEFLSDLIKTNNSSFIARVLGDVLGLYVCKEIVGLADISALINIGGLKRLVSDWGYGLIKDIGFVKNLINKEAKKVENDFEKDLKVRSRALGDQMMTLPKTGLSGEEILKLMNVATKEEDLIWENGKVSGAVYHGKHDHIRLLNTAFSKYSISNPLHADIWPSVMKFESEIIAMTAALVKGNCETVCGATTSGGTESIILAIKAHRDYYKTNFNIHHPEMIVSTSAHAAVDKACDMMNIRLIKIPMDPNTYEMNLSALERSIGPNTILIYSSAPSYPQGVIDNIPEMSKIAVRYGVGLHVDCCLGGFFLPFAKKLGHKMKEFDFSLPGVTSMSLDTHKYGYALKGTSVVLYRTKELRHSQYFCYADWTGGMYTTPTIAGSRSGGLIAQCWASLMTLGEDQYMQHTKDILAVAKKIAEGVNQIKGLKLLNSSRNGDVTPDAMIVCFDSVMKELNIYSIGDKMSKKGWALNALQNPACLHICCTVTHVGKEDNFLNDLKASVTEVLADPNAKGGNAAIYGMTSSLPPGPVNELLKVYNDVVLKV